MASMVFASSPLSAQSLVKLRTNSKYPRSSCYVPSYSKANSYNVHLSYKISHIESSKSSFTTGDGFSKFPLLKFPRVASTLSPSLNIIKASSIYDLKSNTLKLQKNYLSEYKGRVLLIVNIPLQGWPNSRINYFNNLRQQYHKNEFEVLGFIYDKKELGETSKEERTEVQILKILKELGEKSKEERTEVQIIERTEVQITERTEAQILKILDAVTFPIFKKDILTKEIEKSGKPLKEDFWYFLTKLNEDFETILVDGKGIPESDPIPWFEGIDLPPVQSGDGGNPGEGPKDPIKVKIENYFKRQIRESDHQQS